MSSQVTIRVVPTTTIRVEPATTEQLMRMSRRSDCRWHGLNPRLVPCPYCGERAFFARRHVAQVHPL
jgi:hypothetical protein